MKVYITCDMEGATGIVKWEQCDSSRPEFAEGRRLLLSDVNAAIQGAFEGGAREVIVADMHDGSLILPFADLDPRAQCVVGVPHHGPRFPFLDSTVDAFFCVAYHAKAETPHAVLCHTMTGEWSEFSVNGKAIGEVGIDAALAGAVGVPTVLVTGDNCVCQEARELLGEIETAEVKHAVDRHRALFLPVQASAELIRKKAAAALSLVGKVKPLDFGSPVTIRIRYRSMEAAEKAASSPGAEREDALTVRWEYKRFEEHFGGTWTEMSR